MQKPVKRGSGMGISWYNPRVRSIVYQAGVLAAVIAVVWFFTATAQENLERLNISTGFGFLDTTAGSAHQTLIYTEQSSYGRAFLVGLLNTLSVAVIGIVLSTMLGLSSAWRGCRPTGLARSRQPMWR